MEEVSLSEPESHYYADLFQRCDEERTGKIPMLKATELYRAADISNEKIQEIMGLAGIPSTALHISRAQFYSCLKLIAAHQSSIPLWKQLIAASVTLPLPSFRWTDAFNNPDTKSNLRQTAAAKLMTKLINNENKLTVDTSLDTGLTRVHSDILSTDSDVEHCESSCGGDCDDVTDMPMAANPMVMGLFHHHQHAKQSRGSPEAWSTNSDSPTPTNSVTERNWFKDTMWLGLLGEEHKQLLGTEEESSDRHSSDDDNETDLNVLYQITQEQREYYLKQFKQVVQNNPDSLLSGQEAKVFFEKSRIPVEELRHIWELCDVTRDGALSLAEFTAAMHLVVLRRNNIPLPKILPTCLYPNMLFQSTMATSGSTRSATSKNRLGTDLISMADDSDKTKITEQNSLDSGINNISHNQQNLSQHPLPSLNSNIMMSLSTLSIASQNGAANSNNTSNNTQQLSLTSPTFTRSLSNSPKLESLATPPPSLSQSTLANGCGTISTIAKERDVEWPVTESQGNKWTKFAESPTSHLNSPGPKPVNFDIQLTTQAIVSDPQILHPVALRVTPVGGTVASGLIAKSNDYDNHNKERILIKENSSPSQLSTMTGFSAISVNQTTNSLTNSNGAVSTVKHSWDSSTNVGNYGSGDLRAIQRPQAKKLLNKNVGALPPPPQRSVDIQQYHYANLNTEVNIKKEGPPPLPPPRPRRHTRSSSLDLNKYKVTNLQYGARKQINNQNQEECIALHADSTMIPFFADFAHFPQNNVLEDYVIGNTVNDGTHQSQQAPYSLPVQSLLTGGSKALPLLALPTLRFMLQSNQRTSAFEIYRKPNLIQEPRVISDTTLLSSEQGGDVSTNTKAPKLLTAPFGALAAAGMSLPPCINANSSNGLGYIEALKRSQTFKAGMENSYNGNINNSVVITNNCSGHSCNIDLLRQLREQNKMLLSLCTDLSDELITVQAHKEDMRLRLETQKNLLSKVFSSNNIDELGERIAGSSISAPVTANVTGGSVSSGIQSNA